MSDIKTTLDASTAQLTGAGAPWEVTKSTINGVSYSLYKNAPTNLKQLIDAGRVHGDKEFLIYENERITFDQFFTRVDALAYQLVNELNVNSGDRIAIAMRNYPEWMISFAAAVMAGAVIVPLNSWGQAAELEYGLTDSGARIAFLDQQRYDYIAKDLPKLGITAIIAKPEKAISQEGCYSFDSFIESALGKAAPNMTEMSSESTALIMYTSGTTGNPKGATSNHRNVCQSVYNFEFAAMCAAMSDSGPIIKMMERGYAPKVLLSVPLFHVSGCHSVFLLSLRGGRPIVIMHKWDKVKALETIEKERITMISAVPTMLMDMLEAPEWNNYDTSSMFGFGAGGSAQPPRLFELIYQKLPDGFPGTGYGMTETNATGFSCTGAAYAYKPKSTGTKAPIVDIRIVDENGNEVAQGERGEIQLKSPTNVQGYWNKPEATKETFKDGWLLTGDVGYIDEEGFLFITDRIKDMVIRGGENIYSVEVESAILTHEGILEVAAFGIPEEKLGEELAVAIVLKPGTSLNASEIQEHVAKHLAKFKVPSHVFFEESLPKNATLKVMKKPLKEKYSATK
jgi:acyl-CoA synthetase (AMP-forming)/AMP-acid ligase II